MPVHAPDACALSFFHSDHRILYYQKTQRQVQLENGYYPVSCFPCFGKHKTDYGIMCDPSKEPLRAWGFYQGNTVKVLLFIFHKLVCMQGKHTYGPVLWEIQSQ